MHDDGPAVPGSGSRSTSRTAPMRIVPAVLAMFLVFCALIVLSAESIRLNSEAKGSFAAPKDPALGGPNFEVVPGSTGGICSQISCVGKAEVQNRGDAGGALVVFAFVATGGDKPGTVLSTCNAHVPFTENGVQMKATCSAQGDVLEDYLAAGASEGSGSTLGVLPVPSVRNVEMKKPA